MKMCVKFLLLAFVLTACKSVENIEGFYTLDKSTLKKEMENIVNESTAFESVTSTEIFETINLEMLIKNDTLILHLISVSDERFLETPYEFDEQTNVLTYKIDGTPKRFVFNDGVLVSDGVRLIKVKNSNKNLERDYSQYQIERIKELEIRLEELKNKNK